jgi:pimeloyl-ACP methyl ester carboxylesterase
VEAPNHSKALTRMRSGQNIFRTETVADMRLLLSHVFHRPPRVPHGFLVAAVRKRRRNMPVHHKVMEDLMAKPFELERRAHLIQAPTLVLWGLRDDILDVSAAAVLERALRCPKWVMYLPHVGHVVHNEATRLSCGYFLDFLARVRRGEGPPPAT